MWLYEILKATVTFVIMKTNSMDMKNKEFRGYKWYFKIQLNHKRPRNTVKTVKTHTVTETTSIWNQLDKKEN